MLNFFARLQAQINKQIHEMADTAYDKVLGIVTEAVERALDLALDQLNPLFEVFNEDFAEKLTAITETMDEIEARMEAIVDVFAELDPAQVTAPVQLSDEDVRSILEQIDETSGLITTGDTAKYYGTPVSGDVVINGSITPLFATDTLTPDEQGPTTDPGDPDFRGVLVPFPPKLEGYYNAAEIAGLLTGELQQGITRQRVTSLIKTMSLEPVMDNGVKLYDNAVVDLLKAELKQRLAS